MRRKRKLKLVTVSGTLTGSGGVRSPHTAVRRFPRRLPPNSDDPSALITTAVGTRSRKSGADRADSTDSFTGFPRLVELVVSDPGGRVDPNYPDSKTIEFTFH